MNEHAIRLPSFLMFLLVLTCVAIHADESGQSKVPNQPQHVRRVLYNFDGDSCMVTRAGGKGPVAIGVDDLKRLIEEVAYDGSQVDTVLVCVNAQVMYYPTKVGTMRGTLSTPEERWRNGRRRKRSRLSRTCRRSSRRGRSVRDHAR